MDGSQGIGSSPLLKGRGKPLLLNTLDEMWIGMTAGVKEVFFVRKSMDVVRANADSLGVSHHEGLEDPRCASFGQKNRSKRTPSGQKSSISSFGRSIFRMQSRKLL